MSNCPSIDQWHKDVPTDSRGPIRIGAAILLLCLGGFSVWAAVAPLEGAVVVSGSFVATGQNKQVQHLEGGLVRDVLVREGQLVQAGQPVLRLDPTAAEARLRRLVVRRHRLVILKARLEADGFRSRCTIFCRCAAPTPDAMALMNSQALCGGIAPSVVSMSCSDRPFTNSITKNGMVLRTTPKSVTVMMFG
jgi:hypothetical protein